MNFDCWTNCTPTLAGVDSADGWGLVYYSRRPSDSRLKIEARGTMRSRQLTGWPRSGEER